MLEDVIDTAINALDDFELKTFPERVIAIPTGSVSTLNFSLSQQDKDFLYDSGYTTAEQFSVPGPPGRTASARSRAVAPPRTNRRAGGRGSPPGCPREVVGEHLEHVLVDRGAVLADVA